MTENEIKELFNKNVVRTSDEFTDTLMRKVEHQKKAKEKYSFSIVAFSVICLAFLPLIFRILLADNIIPFEINVSPILICVVGSIAAFVLLYRLTILRAALKPE